MNETIVAIEEALQLLRKARCTTNISETGMIKVLHAESALNSQLKQMISE